MTNITLENLCHYLVGNVIENCINYIGIGSAARLFEKKIKELPTEQMHQFPGFLSDYHKRNQKIPIRIVLIDEGLENIPYIVQNFFESKWTKKDNIFSNKKENIVVVSIKENINFDYEKRMYAEDTLKLFSILNNYVIQTKNLMFVHDFSGNNTSLLAEYFDDEQFNGYVLYDISMRKDMGCYFDLDNENYWPIIENGKIFDPFKELKLEKKYKQMILAVEYKLKKIKNVWWPLFRRIFIVFQKNDIIDYDDNLSFDDNIFRINKDKANKFLDISSIKKITDKDFALTGNMEGINSLYYENILFKKFKKTYDLRYLSNMLVFLKNKMFQEINKISHIFNCSLNEQLCEKQLFKCDIYKWINFLIEPINHIISCCDK